jgi:hypothetical protein
MTYQEIKDRLSKCELTLEKLKNGKSTSKDVKLKTEKLTLLRESYIKLLKEADKGVIYTDDEKKAKDLADDGSNVKLTKEQEGVEFSIDETKAIAREVGQAVAKSLKALGDEVAHMKAKQIEPNSFDIYVEYKNDNEDQFSFYITDDTLHLTDFSFDKEISDVGVKPSGEAIVNVDVVANELTKHFKSMNEKVDEKDKPELKKLSKALSNSVKAHQDQKKALDKAINTEGEVLEAPDDMYYIKVKKTDKASQNALQDAVETFHDPVRFADIVDDDGAGNVIFYIHKKDWDPGMEDDIMGNGVQIVDTNMPLSEDEEEDAKNDADYEAGWHDDPRQDEDTDVGHQDDEPNMLKSSAMETAEYAAKLYKKLDRYDNQDGEVDFPNWWQKKLILAREYMSAAYHYLDSEEKQPAMDQLALENVDKVAGGIPYKREGNKFIITEPLDDATKERIISRAKEHGHHAAPNQAGGITIMAKEEMDENRFLAASMEDLEQVIRNLAHTGEMSEDEAIELAIRKLEAMLDGRDDMDEGRKDNDALFPDNPRLPEIKKLADKIVSMVKAEAAQGDLGYIKTMEEIRYQQEDDFERTPEWNKAKGIRADFDDYGSGTNEGLAKTQKAHGLVVAKMKELAKQYKAGDKSVIAQLKDLTAKKKQLEKQLEKDVAGKNKNQQLDTSVNEYRGVQDDLINIIKGKAEDSGFSHEEETEEIIEFLQGVEFDDNGSIAAVYEKVTKEAAPGFKHDCAAKVVHEKYGEGNTIPEKHTLVKEGNKYVVTHYDVLFENGNTVLDIPVNELDIKTTNEHWHKGYKKKKK